MNKLPLPVHKLVDLKGYALLGQTSFSGYFRIILNWWLNSCPEPFEHCLEWCSLSGMYQKDYDRHKCKIEPLVRESFVILKQYREDRQNKAEHRLVNLKKAHAASRVKLLEKRKVEKSKGNIVDKHTLVNPTAIKPTPQAFHEGWNLNQPKSSNINRKSTYKPTLLDK